MIFSAGSTVGLLVYSVAEPLEQQTGHFYANAGYRSQDEKDMFAINLAVSDWGISGMIVLRRDASGSSLARSRTHTSHQDGLLSQLYQWEWLLLRIDLACQCRSVLAFTRFLGTIRGVGSAILLTR